MPNEYPQRFELVGEPGLWELFLANGNTLIVAAHAYSKQDGIYVFNMLMEGIPRFELDVLRIPVSMVSQIQGG